MKKYHDYLSLLLSKEEIPSPQDFVRISICYLENDFLRGVIGLFLHRRYYRAYYIKIRTHSRATIVKRIEYGALSTWYDRMEEINSEMHGRAVGR